MQLLKRHNRCNFLFRQSLNYQLTARMCDSMTEKYHFINSLHTSLGIHSNPSYRQDSELDGSSSEANLQFLIFFFNSFIYLHLKVGFIKQNFNAVSDFK